MFEEDETPKFISMKRVEWSSLHWPITFQISDFKFLPACVSIHEKPAQFRYIKKCRKIVLKNLGFWEVLLPHHNRGSTAAGHSSAEHIVKFFDTIAALMSRHLCGMMYTFFGEIAEFFSRYENGNVYVIHERDCDGFPSGEEHWSRPLVKIEVILIDRVCLEQLIKCRV